MRYYSGRRNIFVSVITTIATFSIIGIISLAYVGTKLPAPQTAKNQIVNIAGKDGGTQKQAQLQISNNSPNPEVDVASNSLKAVVGIAVLKPNTNSIFKTEGSPSWGFGSGIIVDSNGYILTNHHVAGGKNKRIVVTLAGSESIDGVTLWSDPIIDLAVVKINISGLPSAKIGDSDLLRVGETAIAVGNPLGLQFKQTVTSGIVSALNRTVEIDTDQGVNYMEDLIQTDASINPGNSGGALMNAKGEVIGINTIKVASAEGIGFAIPINIARPIIRSFVEKGKFDESYLGLFAYDKEVLPYIQPQMKIDTGIYVAKVDYGSPASKAGIKNGDMITSVDNSQIETMMDLRCSLYKKSPGEKVSINFISGGQSNTVQVVLGKKARDGLLTR